MLFDVTIKLAKLLDAVTEWADNTIIGYSQTWVSDETILRDDIVTDETFDDTHSYHYRIFRVS